jgi:hypothetical protein
VVNPDAGSIIEVAIQGPKRFGIGGLHPRARPGADGQ